jgi:PAS domain S-box-containing protein
VHERLSATEGALATILAHSFEAVVSCDVEGRIVSWNRAAESIFGSPESEAIGASVTAALPLEPELPARMAHAREPLAVACSFHGRELEMRVAPMRGLDQEFLGLVVVARDVTALREAERAARRLETALAARVRAGES